MIHQLNNFLWFTLNACVTLVSVQEFPLNSNQFFQMIRSFVTFGGENVLMLNCWNGPFVLCTVLQVNLFRKVIHELCTVGTRLEKPKLSIMFSTPSKLEAFNELGAQLVHFKPGVLLCQKRHNVPYVYFWQTQDYVTNTDLCEEWRKCNSSRSKHIKLIFFWFHTGFLWRGDWKLKIGWMCFFGGGRKNKKTTWWMLQNCSKILRLSRVTKNKYCIRQRRV